MAFTHHGDVEIYYEQFGEPEDPVLLLINGLGSQCINYPTEWCEQFAAEGFQVVRFDNRDMGLSSKLDGQRYTLTDMANDAFAVLDAVRVEQAHIMGVSMGGMIAQRMAINSPSRVLTLTSVMSTTGEPDYMRSSPEAMKVLMAPKPTSREGYIDLFMAGVRAYGSKPDWIDEDAARARFGAAYDRCYSPTGVARQMAAIQADGSRADELRSLEVPTLVMHGSRDHLIEPIGGRRTAKLVPGARYIEIQDMGHDYPPVVWSDWVAHWVSFVSQHTPSSHLTSARERVPK